VPAEPSGESRNGAGALDLRGIVKSYADTRVLRGVDFRVPKGGVHALLGQNGAGKSTLLKIAVGATRPDSGEIVVDGHGLGRSKTAEARRSGVGMVFQELSVLPNLSVADNVFLRDERRARSGMIDRRRQHRETIELFQRLGEQVDPDAQVGTLGVGDQQMVEIVKALRLARSVLILDEPTAALTEDEVRRLFAVLRQIAASGVGIVYVTHRLSEVFQVCDEVTVLRDGKVALHAPIAACDMERVVTSMVGEAVAVEGTRRTANGRAAGAAPVLSVRGLEVRPKLSDVSFDVQPREILGIAGLAGSGRSTLLKALYGVVPRSGGKLMLDGKPLNARSPKAAIRAGLYLIPENRHAEGLVLEHSIEANVSLSVLGRLRRHGLYDRRRSAAGARAVVDGLGIRCTGISQPVARLSGGNQQKVVLGKALNAGSRLLLLDEPTFGVDVHAAAEIRRRVRSFVDEGNAVLWVTSEPLELIDVADRLLIVADGTVKGSLDNQPHQLSEAAVTHAIQPGRALPARGADR
jgi:ABC-type sugar transport system ATPase subunit